MSDAALVPGAVVEARTPQGLRYAQVTHRHPATGHVVRVIAGDFQERPRDLAALARHPAERVALCPMEAAIEAGALAVIGAAPIPANAQRFPVFRLPVRDRAGNPVYWWYWDGMGLSLAPPEGLDPDRLPLRQLTPPGQLFEA